MGVLEQFDLVIVLELLGTDHHMQRVREVLHLDRSFQFLHARGQPKTRSSGSDIPIAVRARLEDENSFDMTLYWEWKHRAECAFPAPDSPERGN